MKEETDLGSYLKKYFKKERWSLVVTSVLFLLIGLFIVFNPETTMFTFSAIVGIASIAFGIFKLINYFIEKGNEDFYNYDLVYGILTIIVGIIIMVQFSMLEAIFRILIGVWLVYNSLMKLTTSMKMKKYEIKTWWVVLVSAIVILLAGIYVLANPGVLVITIGILMIVYSIMDIIDAIIFMTNVNKL